MARLARVTEEACHSRCWPTLQYCPKAQPIPGGQSVRKTIRRALLDLSRCNR